MDEFESFLAENRGSNICTVTPGGNHGDTLIHMGLVKRLNEMGVAHRCVNLDGAPLHQRLAGVRYMMKIAAWRMGLDRGLRLAGIPEEADLILFEGGSYMTDLWYGPVLLRQVLRAHKKPIAVAPQSYWFHKTDLMSLFTDGRPVTLFCRERYSFDLLAGMRPPGNVRLLLSKDTAFYLERRDLEALVEPPRGRYDLVCFRRDREALIPEGVKRRIIEEAYNPLVKDISMRGSFNDFVSAVANADRVYTDRLHVAILASLFGKETTLFGNRYHKNKGVYEYSMEGNPRVRFVDLELGGPV
ncbi:MAG: polysaccharide pyruvyl transferase family protein [Candidatus Bathyarchaeia archaeon]